MGDLKRAGLNKYQRRAIKAYRQISLVPEGWYQEDWRSRLMESDAPTACGAKLCFMGTVADINGGQWLGVPGSTYGDSLFATADDDADYVTSRQATTDNGVKIDVRLIFVRDRAMRLLGLTEWQAGEISKGSNSLEDIRNLIIQYLDVDPEDYV